MTAAVGLSLPGLPAPGCNWLAPSGPGPCGSGTGRFAAWSMCDGYLTMVLVSTREWGQRLSRGECGADDCRCSLHAVLDLVKEPGGAALAQRDTERARRHGRPMPGHSEACDAACCVDSGRAHSILSRERFPGP